MKKIILTAVLVLAMVCGSWAQEVPVVETPTETPTEIVTVECKVVMIGAGQETIDLQLTAVDGMFKNVWFVLTGDKQEEQMATAYMAVALENTVSVTLVMPVGTETQPVTVLDLTPLKDIYMIVPQPTNRRVVKLPDAGKLETPFTK